MWWPFGPKSLFLEALEKDALLRAEPKICRLVTVLESGQIANLRGFRAKSPCTYTLWHEGWLLGLYFSSPTSRTGMRTDRSSGASEIEPLLSSPPSGRNFMDYDYCQAGVFSRHILSPKDFSHSNILELALSDPLKRTTTSSPLLTSPLGMQGGKVAMARWRSGATASWQCAGALGAFCWRQPPRSGEEG